MYMQGAAHDFYFMNSPELYDVYAMSTMDRGGNMTYLKPQDSGEIVAAAQTQVPFDFRLTPQNSPFWTLSNYQDTKSITHASTRDMLLGDFSFVIYVILNCIFLAKLPLELTFWLFVC